LQKNKKNNMKIFTQIPTSTNSQRLQESYRLLTTGSQAKSILNHTNMKKSTSLVKTLTYFLVVFLVLIAINIKAQLNIDWQHKAQITIESTYIDENLTNWTLVFDQSFSEALTQNNGPLDADGTRPSKASGEDIRFTSDAEGSNELAFDIRDWTTNNNPSSATCEVAVKIPVVSKDDPTTIYMWWGNAVATPYAAGDPFGQYNAYDAFFEYVSADGGNSDRSSNSRVSTPVGGISGGSSSGQIGNCTQFDGNDKFLLTPDGSLTPNITLQSMVNYTNLTNPQGIIWFENNLGSQGRLFKENNNTLQLDKIPPELGNASTGIINDNDWHFACGTYNSSTDTYIAYLDGVPGTPKTGNGSFVAPNFSFVIGSLGNGFYMTGLLDEIRISTTTRSTAWVKADFHNQFNSAGFLTFCSLPDNSYTLSEETICAGETATITQSGSEVGVDYQLRVEGSNVSVGSAVAGTGAAISFDVIPQASLSYNVLAVNATTGCSSVLSVATVSVSSVPNAIITHGSTNNPISFTEQTPIATGVFPWDVAASDMNGDGHHDVAIANAFGTLDLQLNNGDGTYTLQSTAAPNLQSLHIEDIDGDNSPDIIGAFTNNDKISWFKNDGAGGLTETLIPSTTNGPTSVYAIDMDNDGDMDILSASQSDNKIAWFENDGNENFTQHDISTSAFSASDVFAIDMDNDGDMDVLSAVTGVNKIAWYKNDGSQSFTEIVVSSTTAGAMSVNAFDMDDDGLMDVLAASTNGSYWFKNNGDETFTENFIGTYNGFFGTKDVFPHDLDGDGDTDVLSTAYSANEVFWFENTGGQVFTKVLVSNNIETGFSIYAADLDWDGDLDLISGSFGDGGKVDWFENDFVSKQCPGDLQFNEIGGEGSIWTWSSSDPGDISYTPNANVQNPFISGIEEGDIIQVLVEDAIGCTSTASVKVTFLELPDNSFTVSDPNTCPGSIVSIQLSSSEIGVSYQARDDSDDSPAGDPVDGTGGPVELSVTPLANTTYNILATNTSTSCSVELTDKSVVTTSGVGPESNYMLSDEIICPGSNGAIITMSGSELNTSYQLRLNSDNRSIGAAIAGTGAGLSFDVFPLSTSEYNVLATSGANSCQVEINNLSTVTVSTLKADIIYGTPNTPPSFNDQLPVIDDLDGSIYAVIGVDIDEDGDTDVLATEWGGAGQQNINLYRNDGSQTFTKSVVADADFGGLYDVLAVDMDDDGDLDIVGASSNGVTWFENDGTHFSIPVTAITIGIEFSFSVFAVDLNMDGHMDVLSADFTGNSVIWYENNGAMSFTPQTIANSMEKASSVFAMDMDDDGDIDILSSTRGDGLTLPGKITMFRNDGFMVFNNETIDDLNMSGANSVSAADFDGDGDNDILAASRDGSGYIKWYDNDGFGNFVPQVIINNYFGVEKVIATDMDSDGNIDIVGVNSNLDEFFWYQNDGSTNFTKYVTSNIWADPIAVFPADIDGDGDMDIIGGQRYGTPKSLFWQESNFLEAQCPGDIQFNEVGGDASSWNWSSSVAATFDDSSIQNPIVSELVDGEVITVDIIDAEGCTNSASAKIALLDTPLNSFTLTNRTICAGETATITQSGSEVGVTYQLRLNSDNTPVGAAVAGDGNSIDFNVSPTSTTEYNVLATNTTTGCEAELSNRVTVSVNEPPAAIISYGTPVLPPDFEEQSLSTSPVNGIFAIDLDNDGHTDVLSAIFGEDKIAWHKNDGRGNFGPEQSITTIADGAVAVYAADIDGDGDADALSASKNDEKVAWYRNDGSGGFGPQQIISESSTSRNPESVKAADFDNDGDMDVLAAFSGDNKVVWFENNGSGGFGTEQVIAVGNVNLPLEAYAADLDNDGFQDVVSVSFSDKKVAWYKNDGMGGFGPQQIIDDDLMGTRSSFAADLDADGDLDVLGSSSNFHRIFWYENDGLGNFAPGVQITNLAYGVYSVFADDIDNDGDLDVLSASYNVDKIEWYENDLDGIGTWNQHVLGENLDMVRKVLTSDFDRDGDIDVLSASFAYGLVLHQNKLLKTMCADDIQFNEVGSDATSWNWTSSNPAVSFAPGNTDQNPLVSNIADGDVVTVEVSNGTCTNTSSATIAINPLPDNSYTLSEETICAGETATITQSGFELGVSYQLRANTNDAPIGSAVAGTGGALTFDVTPAVTTTYNVLATNDFTACASELSDLATVTVNPLPDAIITYGTLNTPPSFTEQVPSISTSADNATFVIATDIDGDGDMDVLSASYIDNKIAWYENTDGLGTYGTQQVISSAAINTQSVYASDIDGDGDMDVLSASIGDNKIAWYENTDGAGNFGAQIIISTAAIFPNSVYASDMDGDGDMDVLSASVLDNKIAWYENTDGAGSFGAQDVISTDASSASFVIASDIDGDGDMDVLSASSGDDKIAWYENTDGAGSFGAQIIISTAAISPNSVYASDMDGDGDMDVVSASYGDAKIAWYENTDGAGSFGAQIVISTAADGAASVYAADMDGDGDMDVLSASYNDNKIAWYENTNGAGSFGAQDVISTAANGAISVYATDIDRDGDMDVLSASLKEALNDDKIAWYKNDLLDAQCAGDIQFNEVGGDATSWIWTSSNAGVSFAPGNTDQNPLVSNIADGDEITVEVSNGTCTNTSSATIAINPLPDNSYTLSEETICAGETATITMSGSQNGVTYQLRANTNDAPIGAPIAGTGNPITFDVTPAVTTTYNVLATNDVTACASELSDLATVTVNPLPDAIITYGTLNTPPSFTEQVAISTSAIEAWSVYSTDIDGDGHMDVLYASNDGKIAWYKNTDGAGTFGAEQTISTNVIVPYSVYAMDLDGDGDMDVLSASFNDNKIAWYENTDGAGTFGAQNVISIDANGATSVYSTDFDGDGDMDVLSSSFGDNKIAWYENDGTGNFGSQIVISTAASGAYSVYATDMDGDGDMDVLSASWTDNKIAWYENTDGAGTFGAQNVISTDANKATSVYASDMDGDGDMDVVSASYGDDKIAWYENTDGDGTFGAQQVISTAALSTRSVYATDLDGDGDMDVLSASYADNKIAWYENTDGDGTFGAQQVISTAALGAITVYATDIDGDGDMDVLSANFTDDKIAWYKNDLLQPQCEGDIQFNEVGGDAATWTWTSSNAGVSFDPNNTVQNPIVSGISDGDVITVQVGDGTCTNTASASISILPLPDNLLAVSDPTICAGGDATITVSNSVVGVSYQLRNNGDDSPVGAALPGNDGDIDFVITSPTVSATYNVLATIDATGCEAELTDLANLTVNPLPLVTFGGYAYSLPITIPAAKVDGPDDLTDFPLLVSVVLDETHVNDPNGYDIIFTDVNGAALDYERESYNNENGELLAWVRIPNLSTSVDTDIKVLYGNADISSDQSNPINVWGTNYTAVWHFEDASISDATINGNNGVNNGTANAAGQIGQARNFTPNDHIKLPDNNGIAQNLEYITMSAWVNINDQIVTTTLQAYSIESTTVTSASRSSLQISNNEKPFVRSRALATDPTSRLDANSAIPIGGWHYLVGVTDFVTNKIEIYIDGNLDTSGPADPPLSQNHSSIEPSRNAALGANDDSGSQYFDGLGDEFRVARAPRTAGWIKTEYINQLNPSAFLSIGAETANEELPEVCESDAAVILTGGTPAGGVYSGTGVSLSGPDYIFDPSVSGTGTFTLTYTYTDANSCTNSADNDITVVPVPAAPAVTDVTVCEGEFVPNLTAVGTNVLWYSDAGLTTQVGVGNSYNPLVSAPGVYTYYATQSTNGGCESMGTLATLTINDSPEPPASNGDITECEADPVQTLDANNALSSTTGVTWYDAAVGGAIVASPTLNSVGSVTYYAEYNDGTCSSLTRTAVVLTINDSPEPPSSTGDITECEADPVQTLDANDALSSTVGVTWYDASSGGSVVATPTINSVGSVTYYAEYSDGTCSSLTRTAVVLTINDSPEPPASSGDITECEADPVQTLDANDALSSTTGVTWYDAAVGGSVVATPTLNAVGSVTYYAEFNDGTCSSLTRTAVVLTINDSPEPPASSGDITECEADPVQTLDANDALSSTTGVTWYDAAVGGAAVASPTLNAVGSVTYYAEFNDGTCSSLTRTAVVLTINDSPEPPASSGDITECEADPVQTLDANDALSSTTGVTWYDAAVGGAAVASPTLNAVGSVTYYAEFNDGTCSSLTRTAVVLTINDSPEPPASSGDITECEADPIQTLDANNALSSTTGVTWYDAAVGGNVVATPTLNSVGSVTYYAEYNDGTCSSLTRTAVVLTINDSPEPPASNGDITECEADPVQTLDANNALSSTTGVTWYDAAVGGSVVATPTLNSVGSVTYYAEYNDGTCSSLTRTAVVLTINDSPEPPASSGDITECEADPVQTLDANDALSSTTGVTWYDAAVGGNVVATPTLNSVGSVTYYAEFNDGTCSSLTRTAVVLTINDSPEPPASSGDITECEADPVQTLDANNALSSTTGVTWYDAAVGGAIVASPTLNSVGSVTYYAEYNDGTCSSLTRTAVVLTINDSPEPPASNGDITECEADPVQTLDANNALSSTTGVTWYDASSGGSVVATPTLNAVGSVTYYAEFNDGTCSSLTRTAVVLTINDSPEPPASSGDITECEADPVQTLDANDALSSSVGVTWYDASSGGSVVATPTLNTVGSVTYYAEYSDGTCSSLTRTAVVLTINDSPEPPASSGDITECEADPVQTLDANDALSSTTGVTWYDAAAGGAAVASPTLNAVGSVTYYAEFNDGTCSSLTRTAVVLTINDSPEPPASSGDITECEADPVQTLDANDALSSTTGVTWYDAAVGGNVVATPTLNSVGSVTYYAEFNDGTCSSLTRTAVVLTINDSPEPPASSGDITECEADPVQTLDANDALSSTTGVTWYDAAVGGAIVASPTLNAVGSVTYYAEYSDATCSSLTRTSVKLTITDDPSPPASTGDITECELSPIQTLDANNALVSTVNVTWYDASSGGSVVATPTLNAVGSVTYYAEFNDGTCSSLTRTAVVLTINDSPEPPASSGDITECEADPIQTLDANNALSSTTGVTWYDAAVGGNVVATPTLNSVGSVTYYAEFNDGTCSSLTRTAVVLTINDSPEPPASSGDITECEADPVQTLDANDALSSTTGVTWYDAAAGGAAVASPTLNAVGSVTYYAEFNDGTCSSLTRTAVVLTINDSPEPPASSGDITECEADPVQTLDANDALSSTTGVTWYDAAVGGSVVATPTLNSVGSVTYYAEYNDGTCSSLTRTAVVLTINDSPEPPASSGDITECEADPVQTLDANDALSSTTGVTWYDAAVGGAAVASPTLNSVGSVTYYAEFNDGTCSSLTRTAVVLTINDSPEPPASSGDITECEADPVQTLDANDALSSTTGVTWYDAAAGGAAVASPTLNAVGSVTYYAEFNDGTCSSLTRTAVVLTINDSPEPPASSGDITECEADPVQTLDANNALSSTTGVTWYDAAVGGSVVATPTLNSVGSVTYYAEYNDGTCSSLTRTAVVLTINDSPEPPASNGDITECEADPVQTLDANNALSSTTGVTWYDAL
jgi:hypothetical protein